MTLADTDRHSRPRAARDYSLTGPQARAAIETGLASAEWYHSDIPRKAMKDLMRRKDGPALRDTGLWIGCSCFRRLAGS
ncbi:MAG: hypothetical protein R6U99_07640 [Nioella sp.]